MATKQIDGPDSRTRLLDAAMHEIRARGYSDTSVEEICAAAGVTKGSFFHHFKSKEELAVAAAAHFGAMAARLFGGAEHRSLADPLARLLGYIDFRAAILRGELPEYTCLLGTMVQEVYESHPAIRAACERGICDHAAEVARDIAEARQLYAPDAEWTAESLGLFTQAVLQGAFVLAKARDGHAVAVECVAHLRRYVESLFPAGVSALRAAAKASAS